MTSMRSPTTRCAARRSTRLWAARSSSRFADRPVDRPSAEGAGDSAEHRPLGRLVADELVVQLLDATVEREERCTELLGLLVAQAPGGHAPHGLPLEQLP